MLNPISNLGNVKLQRVAKMKRVQVLEKMLSYGNSVKNALGDVYSCNHFRKEFDICVYMIQ